MQEKPKLVVLGGSFNPPTLAHKELMESVMQAVHAKKGLYVPSSDHYVKRKVAKTQAPFCFSENQRLHMLQSLLTENTDVDTCEYGDTTNGRTHTTLLKIQKQYPEYQICFVMGADKLSILSKWKLSNILNIFQIIVIPRYNHDPEQMIASDIKLNAYKQSFMILNKIHAYPEVSSSKIQQLYKNMNFGIAKDYVTETIHTVCMTKAVANARK